PCLLVELCQSPVEYLLQIVIALAIGIGMLQFFFIGHPPVLAEVVYRLAVGHLEQESFFFACQYIFPLLPKNFKTTLHYVPGIFLVSCTLTGEPKKSIRPLVDTCIVIFNLHSTINRSL